MSFTCAYAANSWLARCAWSSRVIPSPIPSFIKRDSDGNPAIGGYTPVFESLTIDCDSEVVPHPDANHATGNREYFIKDRPLTGSIDPDMTLVAANDWWAKMAASTLQAFTTRIGSVAGNICTITGPKVSFGALGYGDRNGIMTASVPLTFTPNTGNDEIKLSFT